MSLRAQMLRLWPGLSLLGLLIVWYGWPHLPDDSTQVPGSGTLEAAAPVSRGVAPVNRHLKGQCLAPDGSPVSGATIVGFGLLKEETWEWRGVADSFGEFQLDPPDNHDCELVVYSDVCAPTRVRVSAEQTVLGPLQLEAGKRLQGVVRRADGHPVDGAIIALRSHDRGGNRSIDFGRDLAVKSSSDGRFTTPLMSGKYTLLTPKEFSIAFPEATTLISRTGSVAVLPIEVDAAHLPPAITVQVGDHCSLEGTVSDVAGLPVARTPVALNLMVESRGIVFDETLTDAAGHYRFAQVPTGSCVAINIMAQQLADGTYSIPTPVEPTKDATTQPGILFLKRVSVNRSDLDWSTVQHRLHDSTNSPAGVDQPANSESHNSLVTQIQDLKNAWGLMSHQPPGTLPDESLFKALLLTGRTETNPEDALTALRFLMEIGGKGTDVLVRKYRELAMEVLVERFLDHPDIDIVLTRGIAGGMPTRSMARHLQIVAERSPHRGVRAMAHLELAQLDLEVGRLISVLNGLSDHANSIRQFEGQEQLKRDLQAAIDLFQWTVEEANVAATQELNWLLEHASDVLVPNLYARGDENGIFLHRSPSGGSERTFAYIASHLLATSPQFAIGKAPPELNGETLDGQSVSLVTLRGTVVVLAFSAQWCAPCRAERPMLRKFIDDFADQPVRLIGISGDHQREEAIAARDSGEITWPTLWDGGIEGNLVQTWNVHSWPTIVVLDEQGMIVARGISAAGLPNLVRSLLEKSSVRIE